MEDWQKDPEVVFAEPEKKTMFFHVSEERFYVMAMFSIGIFETYWCYKNWQYLKQRDGLDIMPFWRAIFAIFFTHSLLKAIQEDQELNAIEAPSFSGSNLATIWIILNLIGNFADRVDDQMINTLGVLIAFPSFLCLLPVQKYINSVNGAGVNPQEYSPWSTGQYVCLVVGIPLTILVIIGLTVA